MAKILLVDDAAFMRKVIKDTLNKNGYTDVHEAVAPPCHSPGAGSPSR